MAHPFLGLGFNSWSQKFSRVPAGVPAGVPAAVAAFLEYVTTSVSSFTLLSTGTVNYEVDWGDGTIETLTTNNPTHTYSSAGEYTIKVTPAEGSTYSPYYDADPSAVNIASVSSTGGSQLASLHKAFRGASNLTSFSGSLDTSHITGTGFSQAWRGCSSLTSFPLIDTSGGTNFEWSWLECSSLTSFPLIDTSSSTVFRGTWGSCSGLTSFPQLDTSSGSNFQATWKNCSSLTSFPLLNTSSGTKFDYTWQHCTGLTSFPQIDTSNGTDFKYAWQNNSSLTSFPLLNFAKATILTRTWLGCSNLTTFPANMFDTTGTLTSDAFLLAFNNAALTPQSIENILVSLDINGQSNIILDIAGGNNAGYSTWTAAAQTALANLQAKGWTISYNA